MSREKTIALVGNPNTGKSTLFNGLTGLKQKIANYPGVTVERKVGYAKIGGEKYRIVDLPGSYSLNPKQIDERITYQVLAGTYEHEPAPDLIVVLVDASNLDRNLYLTSQVMDLGIPVIVVLSMIDVAQDRGINVDADRISKVLGVPVIPMVAKEEREVQKLRDYISGHKVDPPKPLQWSPSEPLQKAIETLINKWIKPNTNLPERVWTIEALRFIGDDQAINLINDIKKQHQLREIVEEARRLLEESGKNYAAEEVLSRYDYIEKCTSGSVTESSEKIETISDKIDAVVTHKIFGPIIFVMILLLMFQSIFSWAEPFMNLIDLLFIETGTWVSKTLPEGILNDLLVEGVIAGLGGVVIFLPQIMFLFFFISILEGTGYMARAAFVMDGFMTRIGLHGRSVVPLMSGFACAIPGIMATRTIENWRDRIITIMVLPFMACSARLPVYAIMIAAFIPNESFLGIFTLQGLTFFGLYFLGIVTAIIAARVMKQIIKSDIPSPFIMELPSYKMPKWSGVFYNVFDRGRVFVTEAGKIILGISIVLWFLASFPRMESQNNFVAEQSVENVNEYSPDQTEQQQASNKLRQSYAGQFGQFIEPVIKPLGFDWKIGIGLITSFAAREVMVGTLNTIYSVQHEGDEQMALREKLRSDVDSETGEPIYTVWTALSLMVFFALAMQCMSTIAIVKRETNSWKWPAVMFTYMTALAYICSMLVYQVGSAIS
ncbi:ferrous iron transport protein B [Rhodohalobacter sulfatireducens]|uniref:Ferrous iron transport protein B n=1 Tax=Rhodohalobacter sulfatireducens TaxID=2911366 RepID=A0ABS9KI92_9BACT|nr:ferrous iron transport protein B [Rhodohalobacter sulfatireducens]MDR9365837.1 ferrous iron transport protein B [Balneolaceae bacterium]